MSSASTARPVTFATALTPGRPLPITEKSGISTPPHLWGGWRERAGWGGSTGHPTGGQVDRVQDLGVSRAPAQVAGKRLADVVPRRAAIDLEQRLRRKEDPRRAVAALRRAELHERLLQRMEL